MTKTRRKWSEAQKLQIVQEVEQIGFRETLRKYNLAQTLLNRWMQSYTSEGITGLQLKYRTIDPAVRQLEQENERLKRIIAKQALEIDFKDELLKKSH